MGGAEEPGESAVTYICSRTARPPAVHSEPPAVCGSGNREEGALRRLDVGRAPR